MFDPLSRDLLPERRKRPDPPVEAEARVRFDPIEEPRAVVRERFIADVDRALDQVYGGREDGPHGQSRE